MAVTATYRIEANLSGSTVKDQFFDEELTDFDAVTPAWDGEVDEVADFDGETDADGDLNDAAGLGHDGGNALEITFDDTNGAFGVINADAVNQTSGVFSLWFDKNDVAVEATKTIDFIMAYDGAANRNWRIRYYPDQVRIIVREDGGGYQYGSYIDITAGYHNYKLIFNRSTGAGDNNGWARLYVNDVLVDTITGIDNDTLDWDYVNVGMVTTSSTTFGGSYYMDTIKIDPVGGPMVDTLAAQSGTYGLSIPVMDATVRHCSFTDPTAETAVTTECWLDPNDLTMGNGDSFYFMTALNFYSRLYYILAGDIYYIHSTVVTDTGTTSTGYHLITDAPHKIRHEWQASSAAGADDGYLKLYIDNVLVETISGVDNDTKTIETISFGAVSAIDATTSGIFYMDDCKWSDEVFE